MPSRITSVAIPDFLLSSELSLTALSSRSLIPNDSLGSLVTYSRLNIYVSIAPRWTPKRLPRASLITEKWHPCWGREEKPFVVW